MDYKRKTKKRPNKKIQTLTLYHPPEIRNQEIRYSVRFRYTATSATVLETITAQNLLDSVMFCSSATTGYQIFSAAKIKFVEVWAISVANAAAQTVQVIFNGSSTTTGNDSLTTDTSLGVEPAHVLAKPGRNTLARNYFISNNNTVFSITAPVNSIVDVGMTMVSSSGYSSVVQNLPLVAATVGYIMQGGLDGKRIAATFFAPIGGYTAI